MKHSMAVCAALFVLAGCAPGDADDSKPWQAQGEKAGAEIVGPDGSTMVWAPAGEFTMGSDEGAADERPAHRVQITKGFWLSKCELSITQWRAYCEAAGVALEVNIFAPSDDHPMMGVNWSDAQGYCKLYGLSMLTEAQWEYAARGPEGRQYPWGDEWDEMKCCNDNNVGPEAFTFPVGSFPEGASWCGALDMAGSMGEWCSDWYAADAYAQCPEEDPEGPEEGTERVLRGGYFWASPNECRSARRTSDDPANRDGSGSLRVSITP